MPTDPVNPDPVTPTPLPSNRRPSDLNKIDLALEVYLSNLKNKLMDKITHDYNKLNGYTEVHDDHFNGNGYHCVESLKEVLVKTLTDSADCTYKEFMHGIILPKFKVGDLIRFTETSEVYEVKTLPNEIAFQPSGFSVYSLKNVRTNLVELYLAKTVESYKFVRYSDSVNLPDLNPKCDSSKIQTYNLCDNTYDCEPIIPPVIIPPEDEDCGCWEKSNRSGYYDSISGPSTLDNQD